jgi:probable HAF family extracellular repeat protein
MRERVAAVLLVGGALALPASARAASFQGIEYFGLQTSARVLSADGSTVGGAALNDSQAGRWRPSTGWQMFASSVFYSAWVTGLSADGAVAVGNYGYEPDGSYAATGASVGFSGTTASVPCAGGLATSTFEGLSADGATALRRHSCRPFSGSFPPFPPTHALSLAGSSPLVLGNQSGFVASGSFGSALLSRSGAVVVGYSTDSSSSVYESTTAQPFRWSPGTGFEAPPVPLQGRFDTSDLHTLALSADGTGVAGAHFSAAGNEAYVWRPGGVSFLGDLAGGAFDSRAFALSTDGSVVVGRGTSASGAEAFVWSDVTGMVGLGDLPGGAFQSFANLVSYDGSRVFGFSQTGEGQEAFVWDAANGMRRVEDLLVQDFGLDLTGWRLEYVAGVSDDGTTIAGTGNGPSGLEQAWIAVIPEPGSGALAAMGAALVALRRVLAGS